MIKNKDSRVYELGINYLLNIIKGKWKPNIMCALNHHEYRYNELLEDLNAAFENKVTKKVLTSHLKELEQDGMLRRIEIKSTAPKIVKYELTEKGQKVADILQCFSKIGEELAEDKEEIEIIYTVEQIDELR
ncbi:winged helix-turn-helix transcriptional regulator [Staphylococcus rostri]|uniref:MarR family transcriptional regulator n=1 Tax=Staphylococcus rostri TaxID=522262 RepID=A0A2K3YUU3_9STAP|nr:helix-turn-helix domain-containing protein [Staphylococcus rostri]PNZ29360.1 MarR family transcriptional regulator [Staphylococcus rostri]